MKKHPVFACDFETTTDPFDCRVWAFGAYGIETESFVYGNSIDDFYCFSKKQTQTLYFHNASFDAEFLLTYLFRQGYKYSFSRSLKSKEFRTIISDDGKFYKLEYKPTSNIKVTVLDSLKIIPLKVEKIPEAFGIEAKKGEIDYDLYRPKGHKITDEELSYLYRDCMIVGKALKYMLDQGLTKMTQGACALDEYTKRIGGKEGFRRVFPVLDCDSYIRKAYKGGYTYLNEKYKNKDIGEGSVYDVNSLYPSVMLERLPYGRPVWFSGKYEKDEVYNLYIQGFTCMFELKEGYLPTIQIKHSYRFTGTEYLKSSDGEEVYLCLTNIDLELFFEHYNVYNITWLDGYKFKSSDKLFCDYINHWGKVKVDAAKDGNKGLKQIAKLMLNTLYGKFGTNPKVWSKIPYYDVKKKQVKYQRLEPEEREPVYIPVAVFITARARNKTIRAAQECYDRFIYADTDSLHLVSREIPKIEIDKYRLGAWDHEFDFDRGRYLRSKCYIEYGAEPGNENKYLKVTVAGLPEEAKGEVNFDNFRYNAEFSGKLATKRVSGGMVLLSTPFKIRE